MGFRTGMKNLEFVTCRSYFRFEECNNNNDDDDDINYKVNNNININKTALLRETVEEFKEFKEKRKHGTMHNFSRAVGIGTQISFRFSFVCCIVWHDLIILFIAGILHQSLTSLRNKRQK